MIVNFCPGEGGHVRDLYWVVGGRRGREMLTMEKLADANQVRATLVQYSHILKVRLCILCEPGESYTKVYMIIRTGILHA